jgi:hypothetical protein
VLSIPDYAYTPYGAGSTIISNQINEFNTINKIITDSYRVKYIDITPISRMGLLQPELVATDGLHPSGIMYGRWVDEILKSVEKELGIDDEPYTGSGISYFVAQRQLTLNSTKQRVSFYISNTSGQIIQRGLISSNSGITLNLNGLATGLYILVAENEGTQLLKVKFVLQ